MPYVIAAKFAHPDRPAIAVVGDGAMQMNGINGLITISKYWERWEDPRLIVCVLNNGDLNQVTWEQRVMEGDPRFPATQDVPAFRYARYAEELGLEGIRVEEPDALAGAWDAGAVARRSRWCSTSSPTRTSRPCRPTSPSSRRRSSPRRWSRATSGGGA